jgi:nucleoside-diphosphate-sugar epimerase
VPLGEATASALDEFRLGDLRDPPTCKAAVRGIDLVVALAADMGGMGYISTHGVAILANNTRIDLNMIDASRDAGVHTYFYASSACVYPVGRQTHQDSPALREDDAYPAEPQDAYGWEKLFGEQLCRQFAADGGMAVRIARLHNVYGPGASFEGGREKAPAALCRKVAEAPPGGTVDVWGDGLQKRSFCYVDDCVEGIRRLLVSDYPEPVNIGSAQGITVDDLARRVRTIAGRSDVTFRHVAGPEGVRVRNSDNTRIRSVLGWEPTFPLDDGLALTYAWVEQRIEESRSASQASTRRG